MDLAYGIQVLNSLGLRNNDNSFAHIHKCIELRNSRVYYLLFFSATCYLSTEIQGLVLH